MGRFEGGGLVADPQAGGRRRFGVQAVDDDERGPGAPGPYGETRQGGSVFVQLYRAGCVDPESARAESTRN